MLDGAPRHVDSPSSQAFGGELIDSLDLPILVVDRELALSNLNAAAARLLSLTTSEIGRPVRGIRMLADVTELEERCAHAIGDGASYQRELRDAAGLWFFLRIAPYRRSDQIAGAVLTFTNVTAFRASLEQAIYEREFTKAIINTVVDPLVVLDDDGRVQAANQAFYAMFQVSREQSQGTRLCDLGSRDWDVSRLQRFLTEANNQSDSLEFTHEFPGIGHRTVLLNARRLTREGKLGQMILLTIQDITQRKQAEQISALLAAIVHSSDDAIISKDLNGMIMSWNDGADRLFGYSADEVIGQPVTMLIPPERLQEESVILERLKRGERVEHFETIRVRKDGTRLDISLTISPVRDSTGHIVGASKVARDITERKRMEQEREDLLAQLKKTQDNLVSKITDLELFHDVTVGREFKLMKLEREVQALTSRLPENQHK